MNKIVQCLEQFRGGLACLWLLVILAAITLVVNHLIISDVDRFESNILRLLPEEHRFPLQEVVESKTSETLSNSILYLVEVGSDEYETRYSEFVQKLLDRQREFDLTVSTSVDARKSHDLLVQTLSEYRYNLLTNAQEKQLKGIGLIGRPQDVGHSGSMPNNAINGLIDHTIQDLFSPVPLKRELGFNEDPFALFSQWVINRFASDGVGENLALKQKGMTYQFEGHYYRLVWLKFTGDVFSGERRKQLLAFLQELESPLHMTGQGLLRAGLVFHAAAGEAQARREISTIGFGSLLAVLLLFILTYRSFVPLVLTLLAISVGCLCALAFCLLLFERVHLVTLAFGASLIGVSVDYCFHFFSARQRYISSKIAINRITPAICIGLVSSVLAYGAQWLTPFPGLRQMALFSVVGLLAVWLTVVLLLPLVLSKGLGQFRLASGREDTPSLIPTFFRLLANRDLAKNLMVISTITVFCLAVLTFKDIQFEDDIRLLNTSPKSLIQQEQKVRTITGNRSTGQYFVVHAEDQQNLLRAEKALCTALDQLRQDEALSAFYCISALVPTVQEQRDNYLLQQLAIYGARTKPNKNESTSISEELNDVSALSVLSDRLELDASVIENIRQTFDAAEHTVLALDDIAVDLKNSAFDNLYLGKLQDSEHTAFVSVVRLEGVQSSNILSQLPQQLGIQQQSFYVDKVSFISTLLKKYRQEMIFVATFAYLMVIGMLCVRYGMNAFMVLAPVVLGSVSVLGLMAILSIPLNLFSVLGFMLLLGVGLDIGIFLQESHAQGHALQAVTLSSITTVFAFGLLSLSQTPVLYSFGIVVLPGILITWLLAWLLFSARSDSHDATAVGP